MVAFLLIVIVCLLISRKLGLAVLAAPLIGLGLLILFLLVSSQPTSAPPSPEAYIQRETYKQIVLVAALLAMLAGIIWRPVTAAIRRLIARHRAR
ncbi:MAG: hypothetical protein DMD60_05175 [Gemmatimonadetes bacterium]|nr:MAG: hypothetical protein DMD60_05175 [Gemmatimonadota bacterium]